MKMKYPPLITGLACSTLLFLGIHALHGSTNWSGPESLNAASGNAVFTDNITLDDDVTLSLFFGAEYLVVAGGGGGGGSSNSSRGSGGGGAGGLLEGSFALTDQNYNIQVGAGGAGGVGGDVNGQQGASGGNSSFDSLVEAIGGGGGGRAHLSLGGPAGDGGSGGGGAGTGSDHGGDGTTGQGNEGGDTSGQAGGGGGGAGGAGQDPPALTTGGDGGAGLASSITGTSQHYAGGGGGGGRNTGSTGGIGGGGDGITGAGNGNPGVTNTGGGGGGVNSGAGGDGGSGIVVVRYQGSQAGSGGTVSTIDVGGQDYTVHSFTSTGASALDLSDLILNERLNLTITGDISGDHGLSYSGPGIVTLAGNNSYTGLTSVEGGTLHVASNIGAGGVSVSAGAALGGAGTITGDVSFQQGAFFSFDTSAALTIQGLITFQGTGEDRFGVENLVVDWSAVGLGTYTLIDGTIDINQLRNVGEANAFDLGDSRSAYFQEGSLQLVVIPEPTSAGMAFLGSILLLLRRRCAG